MTDQDKSFARSTGYVLNDIKLAPLSAMRQTACQSAGARMIGSASAATIEQAKTGGGNYDGLALDVTLLFYTLALPEDEVDLAFTNPRDYRKKAHAWAQEVGLHIPNKMFGDAIELFGKMLQDLKSAQFEVEDEKPQKKVVGNSPAQPS
jgi:hypothetical protein